LKVRGDISAVADRVHDYDEIDYLGVTAGSFDLLVEIVCQSDRQLIEFVNEARRALDAVVDTELFVYLSLEKQKYNWGTRCLKMSPGLALLIRRPSATTCGCTCHHTRHCSTVVRRRSSSAARATTSSMTRARSTSTASPACSPFRSDTVARRSRRRCTTRPSSFRSCRCGPTPTRRRSRSQNGWPTMRQIGRASC